MVSIIQGVNANFQSPANFGAGLGVQIVGAKARFLCQLHVNLMLIDTFAGACE
jgi:hypothetical protein